MPACSSRIPPARRAR
uniref:Uncharacterized protein n=1 Tax=Arundo donax TaxID=35708 RepID=A0A0A9LF11_ARUDO